jgi:ABC-2 type transport system permease protein
MSTLRLVRHQFRYDQRTFWREPASVFFTVALPVLFLVLFVSIFGNDPTTIDGHEIKGATYYLPGIMTLAIVSATFVNLAISVTGARERGILKRVRSTPLPPWVYMAGRICTASVVTVVMMVLLVGLGGLFYDVTVPTTTLPALVLTVVVGTASFCAMGFALTAVVPSESAAPPITNAVVLPLYFLSGLFVPEEQLPGAMRILADIFPVKHLFRALLTAFDPTTTGAGIEFGHLAVLAAWGVVALVVATRSFRWVPRAG